MQLVLYAGGVTVPIYLQDVIMQSMAAELKQQGALEAARDSNSNVTAEDAERKMLEETRKAGAQAYQFDPDASPEEKAAQARLVRHCG